jgi:hypothetical protein
VRSYLVKVSTTLKVMVLSQYKLRDQLHLVTMGKQSTQTQLRTGDTLLHQRTILLRNLRRVAGQDSSTQTSKRCKTNLPVKDRLSRSQQMTKCRIRDRCYLRLNTPTPILLKKYPSKSLSNTYRMILKVAIQCL